MDVVREIIINILTVAEIIVWAWGICQMEFTKKKKRCMVAFAIYIAEWTLECYFPYEMAIVPLQQLGYMIGTVLLFEGQIGKKIAQHWFSVFYLEIVYMPMRILIDMLYLIDGKSWLKEFQPELLSVSNILIVTVAGVMIRKGKAWNWWIKTVPVRYYLLGILCSFSANFLSTFVRRFSADMDMHIQVIMEIMQTVVILFFYILGIGFVFVNLWKEQYKRENILKDKYLMMSRNYYEGLEAHIREVRSLRHDMKNHISLVENRIQNCKYKDAEDYLQEIQSHQEWKNKPRVEVGNDLVNAVLSDGIGRSEEIQFKSEGILPPQMAISDFDLCTIFSNLLSNSIEACKKLTKLERQILLQIKVYENKLFINMENPVEEEVPIDKLGTFTSKEDKKDHGYGIYNIKETVEKYGGEIDFYLKDNKFQVRILINY